mmetsp:Transcript_11109/g.32998  ORF Transcript_11109/g.32998 Transcript_11109/m.32998 type:complete len:264 (-) Transcript_11109:319-1110(-)
MREEERLADAHDLAQVGEVPGADVVAEEREYGGHEVRKRDLAATHRLHHFFEVELVAVLDEHGGAAEHEGHPHLVDGHVECARRLEHENVLGRELLHVDGPLEVRPQPGGGHDAPLGLARGARGVHDVHDFGRAPRGHAVGRRVDGGAHGGAHPVEVHAGEVRALGHLADLRSLGHIDDNCLLVVDGHGAAGGGGVADDGAHVGLSENVVDAGLGPRGVAGHEGGAGLECGELGDGERRRAAEDEADGEGGAARREGAGRLGS